LDANFQGVLRANGGLDWFGGGQGWRYPQLTRGRAGIEVNLGEGGMGGVYV
jgi:hypothetical protein